MKKLLFAWLWLGCILLPTAVSAAPKVTWQARLEPAVVRVGESANVVVTATIADGWHLYSLTQPPGGSRPTKITLPASPALKADGPATQPAPVKKFNSVFKITDELFEKSVDFRVPVKVAKVAPGRQQGAVHVDFMVCDERTCLPPAKQIVKFMFGVEKGVPRAEYLVKAAAPTSPPKPAPPSPPPSPVPAQSESLWSFLALALGAGFAALLTPCVFPMIPITVSFFTKQQEKSGTKGLRGPVAFCLGIIVTFAVIGLLVTTIFGAAGIPRLAANPWVNLTMAAVFIALAFNLFGAFEIMVPPALLDKIQPKTAMQGKPSLVAPVMMGLAFSLTSFTCTVPFVGTVLVSAVNGSKIWPLLGMVAYSAAFAAPFFLLALFPQAMAKLPKSGAWLVSVKAYMGFMELAAALKFLSNTDFVWQLGWLTRPIFLAVWSTIFLLAGFYLLAWLRLPHESPAKIGPLRRSLGLITIAVGIYWLAAINGAPLGRIAAYPPPAEYGLAVETSKPVEGAAWIINDYEKAKAEVKKTGRPLLIDFTGYACTNCREMEINVLARPEVEKQLERFVLSRLYTDGPQEFSRRFSKFQETRFGTVALPFYVILSPDDKVIARFEGYDPDPQKFLEFLGKGLE